MVEKTNKILFASDLSVDMKIVFEQAVALSTYCDTGIIVLHVMDETSKNSESMMRMAFGEALYEKIKADQRDGAKNLLIGKNVDALKIRQAISGFFAETSKDNGIEETDSPIEKILIAEGRSIADEIAATAEEEACGYIVMGCRQQGILSEAMGDHLVKKVLKRSKMPVLAVPFKSEKS
ncbi:MAG: hypothetical protein D3926_09015 [Desulfobacteraceae bacterium]|nr:MAG: hypothetical protein D3926_09015 [Desulfobacteraceae bacterium]